MTHGEAGVRRHFNYANVMSTLAVFGVVAAAPRRGERPENAVTSSRSEQHP